MQKQILFENPKCIGIKLFLRSNQENEYPAFMFSFLKDLSFILFAVTAAGVVPCGGPKKFPRTSSIVQIIFSFFSFEISESILRNQKYFIGLDSFSYQCFIYLALFG